MGAACCSKKRENFAFAQRAYHFPPPHPPPIKIFPVPGQGFQAELRHLQPALRSQILRPINSAGEKLLRSLRVPDRLRIQRGRDTPPIA